MKKLVSLALTAVLALGTTCTLASCGGNKENDGAKVKIGLITLHDRQSTYDKNFIEAFEAACEAKGVEAVIKTGIPETDECYNAAADLVDIGCKGVFADSFGHEDFMINAAREFSEVQFAHATGTKSLEVSLPNYHNAFASIYEGRYLAGVAAGWKLQEMIDAKTVSVNENGNYKLGYVGAFTYAEVISGYTSWFLGVKSVVSNVEMDVTFTGSWYQETWEAKAADTLIKGGAVLVSQHADSMGAPRTCETAKVPNVSYNGSTAAACPDTFIVSSKINWQPYFEKFIDASVNGTTLETDWTGTIGTNSVQLTAVGTAAAQGTQEKIDEVKAKLVAGTLHVFDTSKFTVGGQPVTEFKVGETNVIENGYFAESKVRSAPYFELRIDGITLLNEVYDPVEEDE